jgi:hypothetical protein
MNDLIRGKEVRAYHQLFSHTILRKVATHDPWLFFEMLSSEVGLLFLFDLWHQAVASCGGASCTVEADDFQITHATDLSFPTLFITLPEPKAATEAFHVGVVCLASEPQELAMEKPDILFFTHEAFGSDGREAAFCEWACESELRQVQQHIGQGSDLDTFRARVKRQLEAYV